MEELNERTAAKQRNGRPAMSYKWYKIGLTIPSYLHVCRVRVSHLLFLVFQVM